MDLTAPHPQPPGHDAPVIAGHRIAWNGRDVFFAVLIFIAALFFVPLPVVLPFIGIFGEDDAVTLGVNIVMNAVAYLVIAWAAVRFSIMKYGGGWARLGFTSPNGATWGWAAGAFFAALAVSFAWGAVTQLWEPLQQDCGDQVPADIRNNALLLAMIAVITVSFAPVVEELFFRAFAFPGIARSWGVPAGIIVSGLLFGLAHLGNPELWPSFVQFSAIGMIFAYAYFRSGNILSSMLAHFTFNVIGIIAIAATTCPA